MPVCVDVSPVAGIVSDVWNCQGSSVRLASSKVCLLRNRGRQSCLQSVASYKATVGLKAKGFVAGSAVCHAVTVSKGSKLEGSNCSGSIEGQARASLCSGGSGNPGWQLSS